MKVNVGMLGNWIKSWVTESGEIYGFHNHSVWGGNPYRWTDFTSGHTTFASPFLPALSYALSKKMDERALELLLNLIKFQVISFQEDGQYKHIGFQAGEIAKIGLIHNVVPDVSLGLTALYGKSFLPEEYMEYIKKAILKNMEGCKMYGNGRPDKDTCCNQDYTRIWAKLLYMKVFNENPWNNEVFEDLDFMIDNFHISGFPDNESEGTYRSLHDKSKDKVFIEPAEYYGLMIAPLSLAYEISGNPKYLKRAKSLCLHVVRSSWVDEKSQIRFHRTWFINKDGKVKMESPMLIAGMGITLFAINSYLEYENNEELAEFLNKCDNTYSYYQVPRGYFVSATGWQNEADVVPSTGWHSHDFFYLCQKTNINDCFWADFHSEYNKMSILIGDQCIWVEDDKKWGILDFATQDVFLLIGRKDENFFGRELPPWVGIQNLPENFAFSNKPAFIKTKDGIYLMEPTYKQSDINCIAAIPYLGLLR